VCVRIYIYDVERDSTFLTSSPTIIIAPKELSSVVVRVWVRGWGCVCLPASEGPPKRNGGAYNTNNVCILCGYSSLKYTGVFVCIYYIIILLLYFWKWRERYTPRTLLCAQHYKSCVHANKYISRRRRDDKSFVVWFSTIYRSLTYLTRPIDNYYYLLYAVHRTVRRDT